MMSWMMWFSVAFSYYTFSTWFPTLLVQSGMELKKSLGYSLLMYVAQLPGYFSAAYLNQRFGQRITFIGYMCLSALSAALLAVSHDPLAVVSAGISLSFFYEWCIWRGLCLYARAFPHPPAGNRYGSILFIWATRCNRSPRYGRVLFPVMGLQAYSASQRLF